MLYFLILTQNCDLKCLYCGADSIPTVESSTPNFDVQNLKHFLSQDPDPVLIFYGGEPLLAMDLMQDIMDSIPARYLLQTNALHLKRLPPKYLHQFEAILVSIDGRPATTDYYRGKGVHQRILQNVRHIKNLGYSGDIIARMTVSERTSIRDDVASLASLTPDLFSHVHWQLDVLWDDSPQTRWSDFTTWRENSYQPGIRKLVHEWVAFIQEKHQVPGIVPFQGIMHKLLTNAKGSLPCGAGIDAFSISQDGTLTTCPVSCDYAFARLGHITTDSPDSITHRVTMQAPCPDCEVYPICGGRCLFANQTQYWGPKYFDEVCSTVKYLIQELKSIHPEIQRLIHETDLSLEDFHYPRYNNGLEIIP